MENYIATLFAGINALLFIGLGLPLANNRIPPNGLYGYRVSIYVFQDEEIWYTVNGTGGRHMVFAGIGFLVFTAITALFIGKREAQLALVIILLALVVGFLAYEISWSIRAARRMAREKGLLDS